MSRMRLINDRSGFVTIAYDVAETGDRIERMFFVRSDGRTGYVREVDVAQQPSVHIRVAAGPPGGRALDAAHRMTTGRHEQCLVRARAAIAQLQPARLVVDPHGSVGDELGAHVFGELGQRDAIRVAEGERLRHRQGPIGEVGVRSNEREAHTIARHRV